jgi:hypothetical protein
VNGSTNDFMMNTTAWDALTTQTYPTLTPLTDGGFFAAWEAHPAYHGFFQYIRGRIFNADGSPRSVNGSTNDFQMSGGQLAIPGNDDPTSTTLPNGQVIVGWSFSNPAEVRARLFNPDGTPATFNGSTSQFTVGSFKSTATLPNDASVSVTGLHTGSFVFAWDSYNGTDYDIFTRLVLPNGSMPDAAQLVGHTANDQVAPQVLELADGHIAVSYQTGDSGDGSGTSIRTALLAFNQPPIATGTATLAPILENSGARLITQAELLSNASDPDGNALQATGLAIASGLGKLIDNHNGTWSYTPAKDDHSAVSFSYQVTDGFVSVADSASLDITPGTVHWAASIDVGPHPAGWLPAGIGDFNTDGTSDLAWYNASTGDLEIWTLQNGGWAGSSDLGSHPAGWQPFAFADFNHDGSSDVAWYNATTNDVEIWKIQNSHWAGSVDIGAHPAGAQPFGTGDFNGDGTSDLLWYNPTTNDVEVWKIQNGQWAGGSDIGAHPLPWRPVTTGDFDGNGTTDLLWYNSATNHAEIWRVQNGQWAASVDLGAHPAGWQPIGTGDFNKDGISDIVWYNPATNDVDVWLINFSQWGGSVDVGAHPAGSTLVGIGDFDHSGVADIMWRDTNTGHIETWLLAFS